MAKLFPYLTFENCKLALEYYEKVFGVLSMAACLFPKKLFGCFTHNPIPN